MRNRASRSSCWASGDAEVLLDGLDESGAEFLLLAVHREVRHFVAQTNREMPAAASLKSAALFGEPPLQLLARHDVTIQQICCICNTPVAIVQWRDIWQVGNLTCVFEP